MVTRLRRRLTYSNVMASIAVFVALGGTGYAAVAISGKHIKNRTIAAKKLKKHTLTRTEIKLSKLGTVPKAKHANTAAIANTATSASTATTASTAGLARAISPPEALHAVGAPGQPPFLTGWKNEGFGTAGAAFYKDHEGIVHLQGNVAPVASPTFPAHVFVLPPGYRPKATQEFAGLITNTGPTHVITQIEVQDGGDVVIYDTVNLYASLSGITFRAGQ
jgi:hypothetical protein